MTERYPVPLGTASSARQAQGLDSRWPRMMNANDTPDGRLQLASQKNDVVGIRRELANGALHAPHPTVPPRGSRAAGVAQGRT